MSKVIHVRKFDHANGGRRTPGEVHRELGLGQRTCSFCDEPAAMKGMLYAEADEYARRDPTGYLKLVTQCGGADPAFESKYGKIVRVQDIYGCDQCKSSVKKFLAGKPDWMFADFDEMGLDSSHKFQIQSVGI